MYYLKIILKACKTLQTDMEMVNNTDPTFQIVKLELLWSVTNAFIPQGIIVVSIMLTIMPANCYNANLRVYLIFNHEFFLIAFFFKGETQ